MAINVRLINRCYLLLRSFLLFFRIALNTAILWDLITYKKLIAALLVFWLHHNITFKNYFGELRINDIFCNISTLLRGTSLLTNIKFVFLFFCLVIYLLQVWCEMFFSQWWRFKGIVNTFSIFRRTCSLFL